MTVKNQNLLDFVRRQEYKRRLEEHEIWGHVGGRIYSLTRIVFSIAFAFAMIVNITYLIYWVNKYVSEYDLLKNPGEARNSIIIVLVMSILLILDYFFLAKRKIMGYLICTLIPCIILPIHFYGEMTDIIAGGGMLVYFYKHAAWYLLMVIAMIVLLIIQLRENTKENAAYTKLEMVLYRHASKSAEKNGVFSEEDWEEILKNYNGEHFTDKPMSRSEKMKVKKAEEEGKDVQDQS